MGGGVDDDVEMRLGEDMRMGLRGYRRDKHGGYGKRKSGAQVHRRDVRHNAGENGTAAVTRHRSA
jgi:hypothetical protein